MTEKQRLSLKEAGTLLGITENAVRARFKIGKLEGERDNQGKIWVFIEPPLKPSLKPAKEPQNRGEIAAVRELVDTLKIQLQGITAERDALRSSATENTRLRAEIAGAEAVLAAVKAERDAGADQIANLRQRLDEESVERRKLSERLFAASALVAPAPQPETSALPEKRPAERVGWVARWFGAFKA